MSRSYLVRYSQTVARVDRFLSDETLERGETVVVGSRRGVELGEVLVEAPGGPPASADAPRVLRKAGPADLDRARQAEAQRQSWFPVCARIVEGGDWGLQLLDVEPLLEERRTVLYYAGPDQFDTATVLGALRAALGLDPHFEPVSGRGPERPSARSSPSGAHGCCGDDSGTSGCASGSCGTSTAGCAGCPLSRAAAV